MPWALRDDCRRCGRRTLLLSLVLAVGQQRPASPSGGQAPALQPELRVLRAKVVLGSVGTAEG